MVLPVNSISSKTDLAKEYMDQRRDGTCPLLNLGVPKLNKVLLGGLEWNRILSICALSGGGKSVTLEQFKRDIILLNKDQDFDVLSFDMEMPAEENVKRNVSAMTELTTETLNSIDGPISDTAMLQVRQALSELDKMPIYIVDLAGTVEEIKNTILDFITTRNLAKRNRKLLVTIDHTLLTKGKQGESEKAIVDSLMKTLVELRKYCPHLGVPVIFMVLSQLNRAIEEKKERILNPALHYPNKTDIFAASSVYYSSDYVLISHKPCNINGISQWYGPPVGTKFPKGLPVFNPDDPTQPMVYWHLIKNRFGKHGIIPMLDQFHFSRLKQAAWDEVKTY